MIKLTETIEVRAPVDVVWEILTHPDQVVGCVPGMTLTADKGDGHYEGTISIKFGPTVANFRGQARLTYDHANKTCDIEAGGIDQKGSTRATASAHIVVIGADTTHVAIDGGFNVTGPLAQFARTGGVFVARALLAEFVSNLSQRLATQPQEPTAGTQDVPMTVSSAPAPAAQISGFRLLRAAFLSWVKHLFGQKQ
ncbi:SRPBCC family protein [Tardiphaga sp. OK245]|uniref:SRPBCC family protein n=1 Tax=Tardiphaga sp. OK245 TaxID=1855306 RepID=UPI0008A7BDB9|nr:SRPBCC family protein [Tardiphaga sp. OK245]SEH88301.1 Carbon monoxide dehydrogenase subunit G [Tardiphaga sp. OK245]